RERRLARDLRIRLPEQPQTTGHASGRYARHVAAALPQHHCRPRDPFGQWLGGGRGDLRPTALHVNAYVAGTPRAHVAHASIAAPACDQRLSISSTATQHATKCYVSGGEAVGTA